MNNSIETIWQHGFVDDMALIAPKVGDLYNRKSENLIDRFEFLFEKNQKAVLAAIWVVVIVLAIMGAPILGGFIACMLLSLVFVGKQQLVALKQITKDQNCYDYLVSFDNWLENAMKQYTQIYRVFYPLLFLSCATRILYSDFGKDIIGSFTNTISIAGIPWFCWLIVISITLLLGVFGGNIYRADVNLVYGAEIKKLKSLINEIHSLKS